MTDPKPSTNDILARIRAKTAAAPASASEGSSAESPTPSESAGDTAPAAEAVATPKSTSDILSAARAAAKPAAAPGTTAGILAAARKSAAAATPDAGPKSPSDIMAAIRAKAGAAPAGGAVVDKPPVAVAGAGLKADPVAVAGMSAAEMIQAARSAAEGVAVPPKPKVVLPTRPLPGKSPVAVPKSAATEVPRRTALSSIVATLCSPVVIAWSAFVGSMAVSALATARFMMPNVLVEPPTRFKIGPPNDYAPGTVSTKWQAQFNIWVVNGDIDGVQMIYALSTVCTHLGCTPNWLEGEQKFKCPCHGSGFYKTGVNFEGPAPRPLERVGIRLSEDGMLEVDKSVKFQKELGQWANPSSFVGVT